MFGEILKKVKLDIDASAIIDELSNDDKKMRLKNELSTIVFTALSSLAHVQASIINTEAKGNLLQRSWRPILMLVFAFILLSRWFGYTNNDIPLELELELMSIVKYGIGGYVTGRSVEKVAGLVTENIDLTFLKKKNRKTQ